MKGIFFLGVEVCADSYFFSLSTLKMTLHCPLDYRVFDENSAVIFIFVP